VVGMVVPDPTPCCTLWAAIRSLVVHMRLSIQLIADVPLQFFDSPSRASPRRSFRAIGSVVCSNLCAELVGNPHFFCEF
jgi:hypothetical protein